MPIKYIPYTKNPAQGQAILNNIKRTTRVLSYVDNDKVFDKIVRGMPYYELKQLEQVGSNSDNLVIRGECLSACAHLKTQNIKVDLVYIDPPFASGANYAKKIYLRNNPKLAKKIAKAEVELDIEALQGFAETMYGDIWSKEDYLNWMYENLMAIKEVMSDTASIYVHLDWHIGHYIKILLDEVFGEGNFRNEVIWHYGGRGAKAISGQFSRNHDSIYFYGKNDDYMYQKVYITQKIPLNKIKDFGIQKDEQGKYFHHSPRGDYTDASIEKLKQDNRVYINSNNSIRIKYFHKHDNKYVYVDKIISDTWNDISDAMHISKDEKTDYATQKPEKLLERIIKASSNKNMVVADFFGGSGVCSKVANDLGRRFIHCDIGINSIQTTRDRLQAAQANFAVLEVQDGINLFRNPAQTMAKLATMIDGLSTERIEGINNFWFGTITDTKNGTIPVYMPDLADSSKKVLDEVAINAIVNGEVHNFDEFDGEIKKVIVYFVDIEDKAAILKFIKHNNKPLIDIELRDLKTVLDFVVVDDIIEFSTDNSGILPKIIIKKFISDRLVQKITAYNQKKDLFNTNSAITISANGLELIEYLSLDCTNASGVWQSDSEVKIDKLGFISIDGKKSKDFWDGTISASRTPKRLKVRNIAGDENIFIINPNI